MPLFMTSNEFESRVTSLSKGVFLLDLSARKMGLRVNFLVDFFHSKIGTGPEKLRIFLRKQHVKMINGRGGVRRPKKQVWEKAYFINYIGLGFLDPSL